MLDFHEFLSMTNQQIIPLISNALIFLNVILKNTL